MSPRASVQALAAIVMGGAALCGCSGAGDASCTGDHLVTLSWAPNHESGVNSPGGGYRVAIGQQTPVAVPYRSGALTRTSLVACLATGTYAVTVRAYARLDAHGGPSGSQSAPSEPVMISIPAPIGGTPH